MEGFPVLSSQHFSGNQPPKSTQDEVANDFNNHECSEASAGEVEDHEQQRLQENDKIEPRTHDEASHLRSAQTHHHYANDRTND